MPRRAQGARLYLRPAQVDKRDGQLQPASWIIRDGKTFKRTGCAESDLGGAEAALYAYLTGKYEVDRTPERAAAAIELADVLTIYAQDKVPLQARPRETALRIEALEQFWGHRKLAEVNGKTCRAYALSRPSRSSARRELEDLRSAIGYHRKEGLCREVIEVVLPAKSEPRQRWLTRSEAAHLIWKAYRYREVQKGHVTGRRSRRHVARFILVGLYTGTRAGAICSAAFAAGQGQGFLDLDRGVFYRKRGGAAETKKRQPPVRLPDRLLVHLRRWRIRPEPPKSSKLGEPPRMISEKFAVEFNGKPIGKINKAFGRVVSDAGLEADVTPHVLRHTAATWMMQNGVPQSQAADFLGMTTEMIQRVYGHSHPDFQREAAAGIARRGPAHLPHGNAASEREQTSIITKERA